MSGAIPKGYCKVCGSEATYGSDWAVKDCSCPRCGAFSYDATLGWLKVESTGHMVRLSGWVREQNDVGVEPHITQDVSRRVAEMRLPGLRERANRALLVAARILGEPNGWYNPNAFLFLPELLGRSYSQDPDAALILMRILTDDGLLEETNSGAFRVSTRGWLAVEAFSSSPSGSAGGFVAMSFDDSLREVWTNGFDPAIRAAGFNPVRIDNKEFLGGISDEIIAEIRQSRFVVADYTGQRAGVYFEAGYALGFGLTVIPTCRADEVGRLHFDIRHLNTLVWNDPQDLSNRLTKRILAVIGEGSVRR